VTTRDPLLDRLDQLTSEVQHASRRWYQRSFSGEINQFGVFWYQVSGSAVWIWSRILVPTIGFLGRPAAWMLRQYKRLWRSFTYRHGEFSKVRGGVLLLGTTLTLWMVPTVLGLVWDTGWYLLTAKHHEELYLKNSQEIFPEHNVHAVRGCEELPCTEQNSIYFRTRPSAFNHIWSLLHHGIIFFPDYVAAAAPVGTTKCVVTTYGIRIKLLMRGIDLYPDLLEVSCSEGVENHEN